MKKLLRQTSGETLVEVMVSMVLFLIMLAMLHGAVLFAMRALSKSQMIREDGRRAETAFRLANIDDSGATRQTLVFKGYREKEDGSPEYGNTTSFTVNVNYTGKTVRFESVEMGVDDVTQMQKTAFFPLFQTTRRGDAP